MVTLYAFGYSSNGNPISCLVQGTDGNFYCTTYWGGNPNPPEYGAVYQITPGGTANVLTKFDQSGAGANPNGGLVQGNDGNFYGTTYQGGNYNGGVVYSISSSGSFRTLCSLDTGYANSFYAPYGELIQASDGNFYGTAVGNGYSGGAVFKVTPSGTLTGIHSFGYGNGSAIGVVQGADGNLYGATSSGTNNSGTVFSITPSGTFTTLYTFSGSDGANPMERLAVGPDGNLYGTTYNGGSAGFGTVFRITPSGSFTSLVSFGVGSAGDNPQAGLLLGKDGNFYGVTSGGGANGAGTLFTISPSGSFATLYSFSGSDGSKPVTNLIQGSNGNFYGTTIYGGTAGFGNVFEFAPGLVTTGTVGGFNYQILATNNPGSYTATGLPAGLNVNTATGLISGTATQGGTFSVQVGAVNSSGTGSGTMTIVVLAPSGIPALPFWALVALPLLLLFTGIYFRSKAKLVI